MHKNPEIISFFSQIKFEKNLNPETFKTFLNKLRVDIMNVIKDPEVEVGEELSKEAVRILSYLKETVGDSMDPYSVLGVHRGADKKTIRQKWVQLNKEFHPDVNGDKRCEVIAKVVNWAWNTLQGK